MVSDRWDKYFYKLAVAAAENTRCMSRKVGAILVADGKFQVESGYNGPPIGVPPCSDRNMWVKRFGVYNAPLPEALLVAKEIDQCPRRMLGYLSGKGLNLCVAAHAERNAIDIAARLGHDTKGTAMYLTCGVPCLECAKSIIQAGIIEVVVTSMNEYEKEPVSGGQLLREAGIRIRKYHFDVPADLPPM